MTRSVCFERPARRWALIAEQTPEQHVYSNFIAAAGGAFDLTLDFGHKVGESDPDYAVRVSMSWEQALSFHAMLGRVISNFEEKIGPIPNVLEAEGAAAKLVDEEGE